MGKTGLVVEGGGMKCAYCAGILDAFMSEHIQFDYCIGVSGGSGSAASYASGQIRRNIRFFTEYMHDPEFFGIRSLLKTGNLFGLQYIYGDISNSDGKDPFDYDAFMRNPMEYELAVTNAATGKAEYYGKRDFKKNDYRYFMASCAIPGACKPVRINGNFYYDGGLSDAVPVERAIYQGCTKLVVILSKPRDFVMKPQSFRTVYRMYFRKYPAVVRAIAKRHKMYHSVIRHIRRLEQEGCVFVFAPSRHTGAKIFTRDERKEWALYKLALDDFQKQKKQLRKFLNRHTE